MKRVTTSQLFERWFASQFMADAPCWNKEPNIRYKRNMRNAWLAGRKEGMRYPWGRGQDSAHEYLQRGIL